MERELTDHRISYMVDGREHRFYDDGYGQFPGHEWVVSNGSGNVEVAKADFADLAEVLHRACTTQYGLSAANIAANRQDDRVHLSDRHGSSVTIPLAVAEALANDAAWVAPHARDAHPILAAQRADETRVLFGSVSDHGSLAQSLARPRG